MKRLRLTQWIGVVLGGFCGLMALLMLLQRFGLGTGYTSLPEAEEPLDMALLKPLKESRHTLPPDTHFEAIRQRPLFNNNRLPRPPSKPTTIVDGGSAPEVRPLNAVLTGTIVSNGRRLALVRDNASSKVMVLKPGMPLQGDLDGWTLVSVEPRSAVFDGGTQMGRAELKLDVSKTTGPAPAVPVPPPPAQPPGQPPGQPVATAPAVPPPAPSPADQAAREEEVRRIIEERRAQMRAEAAKMGGGN